MPAALFYCPDAKCKIVEDVQFCQKRGTKDTVGKKHSGSNHYPKFCPAELEFGMNFVKEGSGSFES
jgi:hypothetical protein